MTNVDGSNIDSFKQELLKSAAAYGKDEAAGKASRMNFALEVADAADKGYIGSDDAKPLSERFQTARRNAKGGVNEKANQKSDAAQASKLNAYIKAASKLDGVMAVLHRAIELFTEREGTKGSTYDAVTNVARAQMKADHILDDAEIEAALFPDKEPKTMEDHYKALVKQMTRVQKGKGEEGEDAHPTDQLGQAIVLVQHALDTAVMLRKRGEATALLASQGYTVQPQVSNVTTLAA